MFGTNAGWQDYNLTIAARQAGIQPLALRHRLPDNYKIIVKEDMVVDNANNVIYKALPVTVTKALHDTDMQVKLGSVCNQCANPAVGASLLLFDGWQPVCATHKHGFYVDTLDTLPSIADTFDLFNAQYKAADNKDQRLHLFGAALYHIYLLKNRQPDLGHIKTEMATRSILAEIAVDGHVFSAILQSLWLS